MFSKSSCLNGCGSVRSIALNRALFSIADVQALLADAENKVVCELSRFSDEEAAKRAESFACAVNTFKSSVLAGMLKISQKIEIKRFDGVKHHVLLYGHAEQAESRKPNDQL